MNSDMDVWVSKPVAMMPDPFVSQSPPYPFLGVVILDVFEEHSLHLTPT